MKRIPKWMMAGAALLAVALVAGGALWWSSQRAKAPRYTTTPASVGSITREITASGSVNPVVNVQVGAFVSGNIQALYCDFNTQVRKGQVCATIDPRPYQLVADQARAALETQQRQVAKDRATLRYASVNYERQAKLLALGFQTRDAVDSALSLRDQAQAQVALDMSTVRQRQSALEAANVNLGYTKIVSPVDGTVVSRNVNVGQTVASSFQTPTLFLIAKDLTKMQVDTNVSESDIGGATPGAAATFSVEAWPGRVFHGQVSQVRQAPVSVQNVITYDVVIAADNPDLLLKPGMTATAKIVVAQRDNVLRVPVQALHYAPSAETRASAQARQGGQRGPGGQRGANGGQPHRPRTAGAAPQRVWVLRDGKPARVRVTVGIDDDAFAEITGGALKAGDPVIVSETRGGQAGAARPAASSTPIRFGP